MEVSEIIKALKFCTGQTGQTCYEGMEKCPYSNCMLDCRDRLMKDTTEALEKLNESYYWAKVGRDNSDKFLNEADVLINKMRKIDESTYNEAYAKMHPDDEQY